MKNEPWSESALRVLTSGPRGPEDYPVAAALIDEGFAKGNYRPNWETQDGGIAAVRWEGPTVAGREYAERLAERTWKARLARYAFAAALSGIAATFAAFMTWLFGC